MIRILCEKKLEENKPKSKSLSRISRWNQFEEWFLMGQLEKIEEMLENVRT